MRTLTMLTGLFLAAAVPAAAPAQYEPLVNPPDPAAQQAEMVALYDEVCLRAFPDEAAAARAVARYRATPHSPEEVRLFLHDDPGIGWRIAGRTGRFDLNIEQAPPYRSCAVRTMTVAGFADMAPYEAVAARYARGRGLARFEPMDRVVRGLRIVGGGERRVDPDGSSESLLAILTTPAQGNHAVEVRFAHQYYRAPGP
jgi:hypothetical protein